MRAAHVHEVARLQAIIDAQRQELDHRADIIAAQADALAERAAELDDAIRAGQMFAARAAVLRSGEWCADARGVYVRVPWGVS